MVANLQADRRQLAVIADVDGTLCDVSSVRHYVLNKPKNFDKFHQASRFCPPHQMALDWCKGYHDQGYAVIVVTGRMHDHHEVTYQWLREHMPCPFFGPFMRPHKDLRSDVEVKREIYHQLTQTFNVKACIDDNPRIIALWEELGLSVTVVPGWDHNHSPAGIPTPTEATTT